MARWAVELSEFDIQYKPCLEMKRQVLADFLEKVPQQEMKSDNFGWWILNVDDTSRPKRAGLGLQLEAPTGEVIEQAIRLDFPASNSGAEYEDKIVGLDLKIFLFSEKIIIRSDYQLVVGQVNGEYKTKDQRMTRYVSLVNLCLGSFVAWRLEHVPRNSNEKANSLAAVAAFLPIKEIVLLPMYYLPESSITTNRVNEIDETGHSLMTPIVRYFNSGELPNNRAKSHKIQV